MFDSALRHRISIPVVAVLASGLVGTATAPPPTVPSVRVDAVSVQLQAVIAPYVLDAAASPEPTTIPSASASAAAGGIVKRILSILAAPVYFFQFLKLGQFLFNGMGCGPSAPPDCAGFSTGLRVAAPTASMIGRVATSISRAPSVVSAKAETASRKHRANRAVAPAASKADAPSGTAAANKGAAKSTKTPLRPGRTIVRAR